MPITLHAAFVPSALQMLGTVRHLVGKAEGWCSETGQDPAELVRASIHEDMLPFAYQVKSVAVHTASAVEAVRNGVFSPHLQEPPYDLAGLRDRLGEAVVALEAVGENEMESFIGQPMRFEFRDHGMDFTAEDFLLSFSQPNFYFHAATAYDILRMKGVAVGKRDFMGAVRLATAP